MSRRARARYQQAHRVNRGGGPPWLGRIAVLVLAVVVVCGTVASIVAAITAAGVASSPGPSHGGAKVGSIVSTPGSPPPSFDDGSAEPSTAPPASTSGLPNTVGSGARTSGAQARPSPFGLGLLIADRGNGRLLIVDWRGRTLWRFPGRGSLPKGQSFAADDAFLAPDGRTIVANDEEHQVIDRIDIASRRVIWQYGHYDRAGSGVGFLHTPDDAYQLANGDITVADIRNCRILEVGPAKELVRQLGHPGVCVHDPPRSFDNANGDTPLPDGGLLVTEIGGSRVVRLSPSGHVLFDIHTPTTYPSDAHLTARGDVLVVDYHRPGAIIELDPRGHVVWRYGPASGRGMLDHPSLAIELPNGWIALNDDFRQRVVVIDPVSKRIVWQYGRTDHGGRAAGELFIPDGIDPIPAGTRL